MADFWTGGALQQLEQLPLIRPFTDPYIPENMYSPVTSVPNPLVGTRENPIDVDGSNDSDEEI